MCGTIWATVDTLSKGYLSVQWTLPEGATLRPAASLAWSYPRDVLLVLQAAAAGSDVWLVQQRMQPCSSQAFCP